MLQGSMICGKTSINCCLCSRLSKLHPWMVVFDLPMPREAFILLHKLILGRTRYGIDVGEKRKTVGKGQAKLIVNEEKKGTMTDKKKENVLREKFHDGYWSYYGFSQH
ncbi:hypothetical protein P5673_023075 [Acropora cervicornis]|uniref:Uncharacterized protein n=1 Tax=Acropora cervicornis TaxID=6130 RepID=A0AAD9UYY9_ACRCE|nr:hypothetical protein P5673_023075 [Acropora cervicornis]